MRNIERYVLLHNVGRQGLEVSLELGCQIFWPHVAQILRPHIHAVLNNRHHRPTRTHTQAPTRRSCSEVEGRNRVLQSMLGKMDSSADLPEPLDSVESLCGFWSKRCSHSVGVSPPSVLAKKSSTTHVCPPDQC